MDKSDQIKTDFSYTSHYVNVLDSKMHYIEDGAGDPVIFLHGIPTSNYLWRNVIPYVAKHARCIAPDLIGLGKSGKPNIKYSVFDHIRYLEEFIKVLNLQNITLVLHGWGSVIGLAYAMKHEKNVKAISFFESHIRPVSHWQELALPVQEILVKLQQKGKLSDSHLDVNNFIDKYFASSVMRRLSEKELAYYKEPFQDPKHRQPLLQYLQEYPTGLGAKEVLDLIYDYSKKLAKSSLPKLMLYAIPGFNTTVDTVAWAAKNLKNLAVVDIGEALHCPQESQPHVVGQEIASWYSELASSEVS